MTEKQQLAWERLNQTFDTGVILPKKYGMIEPSLKDAILYDTPYLRKNWKEDRRKTNIPNYKKEKDEDEVSV